MKLRKNRKIKLTIILILSLFVILSIFFVIKVLSYRKYDEYGKKIEYYGFNSLYNNSSVSSYQSISKLEAIKLVIAITLNTTNVNEFEQSSNTENEKWISYALKKGIISSDEQGSIKNRASYIDFIRYLSNAKYYILGETYSTEIEPSFKDIDKYSQRERTNITDLVSSEIIENNESKLKGKSFVNKGIANKLLIQYYEKYILANGFGTIRNDNTEEPSNSNQYPYLLDEVENEVYEQEFDKDISGEVINPVDYYVDMKDYYTSIKEQCEAYYSLILNVDYRTIDENKFKEDVQKLTMDIIDDYTIKKYVEYVKSNRIILSGKATVQMPIVYNDGFYCRARTKLEINVENSDTMDNILFLDLNSGKKVKYTNKNMIIYVDSLLSSTLESDKPYMKLKFISEILLDVSKDVVIVEVKTEEVE